MNTKTRLRNGEEMMTTSFPQLIPTKSKEYQLEVDYTPEILFITSFPPRECGIATYSQDLIQALKNKFNHTFSLKVCALESGNASHVYTDEVKFILNTNNPSKYTKLAHAINMDDNIKLVIVQHEFGFFQGEGENAFLQFLYGLNKPSILVFHTVLPQPDDALRAKIRDLAAVCENIVVMTHHSEQILITDYYIKPSKIVVIPHGTHLVPHLNKDILKEKYGLTERKVLSTFGLLSSGKNIETTIEALPSIIKINPEVIFLIIGKTHPSVKSTDGEEYRDKLVSKVTELQLENHVRFINQYVPLQDLLEYLQLTDIYLLTSNDPNQAVSGTFSYAMSCGCPIISTPIPHAKEVLTNGVGIIIDFKNSEQLAENVNLLMGNDALRENFIMNTLQKVVPTAWENSAIAHAILLQKTVENANVTPNLTRIPSSPNRTLGAVFNRMNHSSPKIALQYTLPPINLDHFKKMTTDFGIVHFSKINRPDVGSGYSLDDNTQALIAFCMHYEWSGDKEDVKYIRTYLNFIKYCQQPNGNFLSHVDSKKQFVEQNNNNSLYDANGRAIWALGYFISKRALFPSELIEMADDIIQKALPCPEAMHSIHAIAFSIKGLFYYNLERKSSAITTLIKILTDRLVQKYHHESEPNWLWYEGYLTNCNSIIPEAILYAYLETREPTYKEIAKVSFDFLVSHSFNVDGIKVISDKNWMHKRQKITSQAEQPLEVAYTVLALSRFYSVFNEPYYLRQMDIAFNWFLGNNRLHQIIYNTCTGGCYDGLEDNRVNLNQGAEAMVSYMMARLSIEKYKNE